MVPKQLVQGCRPGGLVGRAAAADVYLLRSILVYHFYYIIVLQNYTLMLSGAGIYIGDGRGDYGAGVQLRE